MVAFEHPHPHGALAPTAHLELPFFEDAHRALANGLVLPAHDYVLQCSHAFNVLDTRGAVGVTERQDMFRRMRDISRKVAESYYEQRKELGFPWLKEGEIQISHLKDAWEKPVLPAVEPSAPLPDQADFLFEIGTEELPAGDRRRRRGPDPRHQRPLPPARAGDPRPRGRA